MVASTRLTLVEATEAEPATKAKPSGEWCCRKPASFNARTTEVECSVCGRVLECCGKSPVTDWLTGEVACDSCGTVFDAQPATIGYPDRRWFRPDVITATVAHGAAHDPKEQRRFAHLAIVDSHERQRDLAEDPRTTRQRDGNRERVGMPGSATNDIEAVTRLARRERLLRSQDIPTQEVAVTWNVTRVHARRGEPWAVHRFQILRVRVGSVTRTVSPLDRLCVRLGVDRRVAKRLAYALMRARVAERAMNVGGGGK
jgi:transcription initiation factor TFIIIB Brf1 subunit/transcription initiation factor TFIIB